ncbi:MAG: 50S ribosomal protein L24 [Elusimicrobia bacterium]|jgi:large subunit ribosomal protein L24|nr:50S ribosomal protein L24 [Elusimicrobiota bacterium]
MYKIKKNDNVIIKTGKDKGKTGEVVKIIEGGKRALISKLNLAKVHTRPSQTNPGGVVEKETPVNTSNIQVICPKCSNATRINFDRLTDGEKVRICKKCGEMIV